MERKDLDIPVLTVSGVKDMAKLCGITLTDEEAQHLLNKHKHNIYHTIYHVAASSLLGCISDFEIDRHSDRDY